RARRLLPRLLPQPLDLRAQLAGLVGPRVQQRPRLARGDGLDAPRAGADRPLGRDHERADLGGRAHVRAAAELAPDAVDVDDAHLVAVLLAEEHHRAELARLLDRRHVRADGVVLEHPVVDAALDLVALLGRHGLRVREVEAELVRADGGARLARVVA